MAETIICFRMGQSNSFGAAANSSIDSAYKQTFANIKTWTGAAFASLNYAVNNNQYPAPLTDLSASEYAILTGLQARYGGTIYDIKYAVPDTYLGTTQAANWNTATRASYLDAARSTISDAMLNLWNLGLRTFKVFVFYDQGEGDSKNSTDANNYQTNFTNLINVMQKTFGTCATVYFINPRIGTDLVQTATKTTVTNATNANPIVITTAAAHTLTTGDHVEITGVVGNTAANNADIAVTVLTSTTFSIPIAGNGAYVSGGNVNPFVFRATVDAAQAAACAAITRAYSHSTDGMGRDSGGVHRTAAQYVTKATASLNIISSNGL